MVYAGKREWEASPMIEPIMYFGIGFLFAALIGLVVIPLVHGRAVRLTVRRLKAATPLSMAEIQADKDQLRAEFAMSTRRLEMSVEQLKTKTTSQLAELGKKGDAINRLKMELGEKTATIFALEATKRCAINCARPRMKSPPRPVSCTMPSARCPTSKPNLPNWSVNSTTARRGSIPKSSKSSC
jgi:hypothetical protein